MNFESPSKILKNQKIEKVKTDKKPNMNRRDFLRLSAFAAISVGTAITTMNVEKTIWDKAKNFLMNSIDEHGDRRKGIKETVEGVSETEIDQDGGILKHDIPDEEIVEKSTVEQTEIEEQDAQSLSDILDFKQEKIDLNVNTYKAVEAYWKKRYSEDEKLYTSLQKAYKKMGAWKDDLKKEFKKEGVPEKYIYLAIPESHWVLHARSKAGATGPYQFIRSTAQKRGLKTGTRKGEYKNIDERMDPILSARACARELKYLYNKCEGDWELALSAYNGGFFWKYKGGVNYKREKGEKTDVNYQEFMEYLEDKINKLMNKLKNNTLTYKVRKGDTLSKIAKKYHTDLQELMKENKLNINSVIHKNDKLKIPVDKDNARKIYEKMIAGYSENLNYPAKFNAVISLINEGIGVVQDRDLQYSTLKVKNKLGARHKLKKGETLYSLHRKYKISVAEIEKANPKLNPNRLSLGTFVVIPNKKKSVTLFDIAKEKKVSLNKLKSLNTSIINYKKPLPDGFEVRL